MTLANKFTMSRVLLAPVFCAVYFMPSVFPSAGALSVYIMIPLLVFMELTDFFDGYFARKMGEVSDFGKLFDPFGDVLVHLTTFFCFICSGYMRPFVFILIFYREFSMLFLRLVAVRQGIAIGARKGGKLKTVLYVVAGFWALFRVCAVRLGFEIPFGSALGTVGDVLFLLCLLAAYVSFVDYLLTFGKVLKDLK